VVQEVSFEWENTCPYWCLYSSSDYRLSLVYTYLLTIHTERWLTIYVVQTSPAGLYEGCTCITELEIVLSTCSGRQDIYMVAPKCRCDKVLCLRFLPSMNAVSLPGALCFFPPFLTSWCSDYTPLNSYERSHAVYDILLLVASFMSLAGCLLWSAWICFVDQSYSSWRAIITIPNNHSH
jgi:hypothetical protein